MLVGQHIRAEFAAAIVKHLPVICNFTKFRIYRTYETFLTRDKGESRST